MVDLIYQTQFDDPRSEQAHRPAGVALGRIGAGEEGNLGLNIAGDFRCTSRSRLFQEGGLPSFFQTTLAHVGDGSPTAQEYLGNLFVGAPLCGAAIGEQENASAGLDTSGRNATLEAGFEFGALFGFKVKGYVLAHNTPSLPDSRR